jgi:hypothetical protein
MQFHEWFPTKAISPLVGYLVPLSNSMLSDPLFTTSYHIFSPSNGRNIAKALIQIPSHDSFSTKECYYLMGKFGERMN